MSNRTGSGSDRCDQPAADERSRVAAAVGVVPVRERSRVSGAGEADYQTDGGVWGRDLTGVGLVVSSFTFNMSEIERDVLRELEILEDI